MRRSRVRLSRAFRRPQFTMSTTSAGASSLLQAAPCRVRKRSAAPLLVRTSFTRNAAPTRRVRDNDDDDDEDDDHDVDDGSASEDSDSEIEGFKITSFDEAPPDSAARNHRSIESMTSASGARYSAATAATTTASLPAPMSAPTTTTPTKVQRRAKIAPVTTASMHSSSSLAVKQENVNQYDAALNDGDIYGEDELVPLQSDRNLHVRPGAGRPKKGTDVPARKRPRAKSPSMAHIEALTAVVSAL